MKSNRFAAVLSALILSAAVPYSLFPVPTSSYYEKWENAPLGIAITRCDFSTRGVYVKFETDLNPPYYVGIYRPDEENLGRRLPVAEKETRIKEAFFPGDYTSVTLFAQVMTKDVVDRYAGDEVGRHVLTREEADNYMSVIRNAAPYVNHDAASTFEIDRRNTMELIEDYTWVGFVKTADMNLTINLRGIKYEIDPDVVTTNVSIQKIVQDVVFTNVSTRVLSDQTVYSVTTNSGVMETIDLNLTYRNEVFTNENAKGGFIISDWSFYGQHNDHAVVCVTNYTHDTLRPVPHNYSLRLRDGSADVGTGYRIMMFEDSGVCQAQRAYSARTNMSDAVVLPAGFRALSSHNGYIYTTDWHGRRYFQKVTNRVDHIFR